MIKKKGFQGMQKGMTPRALLVARRLGLQEHDIQAAYSKHSLTIHDIRRYISKERTMDTRQLEVRASAPASLENMMAQPQRVVFCSQLSVTGLSQRGGPIENEKDLTQQWVGSVIRAVARASSHISGLRGINQSSRKMS